MKAYITLFLAIFMFTVASTAQNKSKEITLKVVTDKDSIGVEDYIQVTFILENATSENFEPPVFEDFDAVNTMTSREVSYVNGKVNSRLRFVYNLRPKSIGSFIIQPAIAIVEGQTYQTETLTISVSGDPSKVEKKKKRGWLKDKSKKTYKL